MVEAAARTVFGASRLESGHRRRMRTTAACQRVRHTDFVA